MGPGTSCGDKIPLALQGIRHFLNVLPGLMFRLIAYKNDEFITAHTVGVTGMESGADLIGHRAEHVIAGFMPLGIVEFMKTIDIYEDTAEVFTAAVRQVGKVDFIAVAVVEPGK